MASPLSFCAPPCETRNTADYWKALPFPPEPARSFLLPSSCEDPSRHCTSTFRALPPFSFARVSLLCDHWSSSGRAGLDSEATSVTPQGRSVPSMVTAFDSKGLPTTLSLTCALGQQILLYVLFAPVRSIMVVHSLPVSGGAHSCLFRSFE